MRVRGFLAAAFVILVWGVTFVNTKALLVDFSALEIQVLRFAVAWVVLVLYDCFVLGARFFVRHSLRDETLFAMMGLFGVAVYQLLENCAIHYTNASNVSILVCMCPLLTAVVAHFLPGSRERGALSPLFFTGFAVAITGVTMVSLNGIEEFHFNPLGDLMAAFAMFSWVIYSNLVPVMSARGYGQSAVIRRMFFWALVFMSPFVIFGLTEGGASAMDGSLAVVTDAAVNARRFSSPMNWVNLGFLGFLASALCFVLWNRALAIIGMVRCTVGLYLLPAVTVMFAYAFLGERLTPVSATGAVLILVGVVISGWRNSRRDGAGESALERQGAQ